MAEECQLPNRIKTTSPHPRLRWWGWSVCTRGSLRSARVIHNIATPWLRGGELDGCDWLRGSQAAYLTQHPLQPINLITLRATPDSPPQPSAKRTPYLLLIKFNCGMINKRGGGTVLFSNQLFIYNERDKDIFYGDCCIVTLGSYGPGAQSHHREPAQSGGLPR